MSKQINVSDRIVSFLDGIRNAENASYSGAIEKLITTSEGDLALNEINKRFAELESLMPDMQEIFELMRVLALHTRKLPIQTKEARKEEITAGIGQSITCVLQIKEEDEDK